MVYCRFTILRNVFFDGIFLPFGYRAIHKVRPKITGQHATEVLFSHIKTIVHKPLPHTIHSLIPRLLTLALRHNLVHLPGGYRPVGSPGNLRQVVNLARHFVVLLALAWPRKQQALERRIHFIARESRELWR